MKLNEESRSNQDIMSKAMPKDDMNSDVPDKSVSTEKLFCFKWHINVPAFSKKAEHVPDIDPDYHFEPETTKAILAGFVYNRRVLIQGYHGTGKSTHIEQVAARLNWPCIRVNLDSHISRTDLIGRDVITLKEGKQITQFQEGILPWSLGRPMALVFDEYDAGRPDVMFVIQRILEAQGKLTLLDQNRVLTPHPYFRLFATTNTIGMGDSTGLYHGTQPINQGQMDRWNIVASLNYLPPDDEMQVVLSKVKDMAKQKDKLRSMIAMANLTREGFTNGDLSTVMSPRTVINWAENTLIFGDVHEAFKLTFLNKSDENERIIFAEYYQRSMNHDILTKQ
jgi:cobaltochelatase CobS